jgi:hypothetical protein
MTQLPLDNGAPRSPVPAVPQEMTERAFQELVVDVAKFNGWTVHHQQPLRTATGRHITAGKAGFPDLTLLRPPQLVFLELKRVGGVASAKQKRWVAGLQGVPGVEAFIVTPFDLAKVFLLLVTRPGSPPVP